MDNVEEDVRKKRQTTKRDSAEVVKHDVGDDDGVTEKTKKLRKEAAAAVDGKRSPSESAVVSTTSDKNITDIDSGSPDKNNPPIKNSGISVIQSYNPREADIPEDLESALNFLVGMNEGQVERISDDAHLYFRLGHAGDASTIATWYREQRTRAVIQLNDGLSGKYNEEESSSEITGDVEGSTSQMSDPTQRITQKSSVSPLEQETTSALELWLADGLGDEGIPPSLFALLAYVNFDKDEGESKTSRLAAIALLTLAWEQSSRVLRVEWFHVDSNLDNSGVVERRVWLRLSALSLMTACEMHVVEPSNQLTKAVTAEVKCL